MIYLILCLYAFWHGKTNAFLYSRLGADALPRNEHIDLVIERGLVVLAIIAGGFLPIYLQISEVIASILAFSYWHNGAYYLMRAKIDGANLSDWRVILFYWQKQSTSSTAKYDFNYLQRRDLLYLSLLLMAITYTLYFFLL